MEYGSENTPGNWTANPSPLREKSPIALAELPAVCSPPVQPAQIDSARMDHSVFERRAAVAAFCLLGQISCATRSPKGTDPEVIQRFPYTRPDGVEVICAAPRTSVVATARSTSVQAQLSGAISAIKSTGASTVSVGRSDTVAFLRVRGESAGTDAFEVKKFALCEAYGNGGMTPDQYAGVIKTLVARFAALGVETQQSEPELTVSGVIQAEADVYSSYADSVVGVTIGTPGGNCTASVPVDVQLTPRAGYAIVSARSTASRVRGAGTQIEPAIIENGIAHVRGRVQGDDDLVGFRNLSTI